MSAPEKFQFPGSLTPLRGTATLVLAGLLIFIAAGHLRAASPAVGSTPTAAIADQLEQDIDEPVFHGRIHIIQTGLAQPERLILVHGLGDEASRTWMPLLPELSKRYHVIILDLPGFGRSSKDNLLYSPANYAKLIHWLAQTFNPKKPFILAGHSMGGVIALYFAAVYPRDLRQLVLIDSAGILHRAAFSKSFLEIDQQKNLGPLLEPALLAQQNNSSL